jgi:esterase/lipase
MRKTFSSFFVALSLTVFGQRSETVYRTKGDTLQNYYKVLMPDSISKGLLVIIGGFCGTPSDVMQETKLPETAVKAGYTVVIPFLVDDCNVIDKQNLYQSRLESLIPEVIKNYNIPAGKFIIGGQSLGGHRAMYYSEKAYKLNDEKIIRPNAVFGVDPPLDLKRLWNTFTYLVRINFSEISIAESTEQLRRFKIMYGGSPSQFPKIYEQASSYYAEAKDGGNAKYLRSIPVRLYCDPDINWIIENRRGSFATMNATDLSACISQLKLLGNQNAEFVNCLGKGFKPDGTRHPHYFSMLDPDEFILWANKIFEAK